MTILVRIRAQGGDVIREEWRVRIRRGRLTDAALEWLREPRVKDVLMREVWPQWDDWNERAAIREFDGGQDRSTAESDAYREVMQC